MLAYASIYTIILRSKSSKISHVLKSDYNLKVMRRSMNDVLSTCVLDGQLFGY